MTFFIVVSCYVPTTYEYDTYFFDFFYKKSFTFCVFVFILDIDLIMLKENDTVYIKGETFKVSSRKSVGDAVMRGGLARLLEKTYESREHEVWMVDYCDGRYKLPIQRLFFKNDLPLIQNLKQPENLTKEKIMATRKTQKKSAKKVVKKKVVKKKPEKEISKSKKEVIPLSRFTASLIEEQKLTDEKIVKEMKKQYPDRKGTKLNDVAYYRKMMNDGKMEKAGFPTPSNPYEPVENKKRIASRKK